MMEWINDWLSNPRSQAIKPSLDWIDQYTRSDGEIVKGHLRTEADASIANNLGTDVDQDGIPGFFDSDETGDGLLESLDLDGNGVADGIEDLIYRLGDVF
jgi:hypothetical protein